MFCNNYFNDTRVEKSSSIYEIIETDKEYIKETKEDEKNRFLVKSRQTRLFLKVLNYQKMLILIQ
ncbi:MAG: hypothetical protein OCD02_05400 [Spirochaetaceae bacterium]